MKEFGDGGRQRRSGGGEHVAVVDTYGVAQFAEYLLVEKLILHFEPSGHFEAEAHVFEVALCPDFERALHHDFRHAFHRADFVLHGGVDFLPETRHAAHTRRAGYLNALLNTLGVGVNGNLHAFAEAEVCPSFLEDMAQRQEAY